MNYRTLILHLFILLFPCFISGQPKCHIQHYGLQDGLPQRSVMDMLQDKKGFMWFATWGGLCKFDGYNFTTYKATPDDAIFMGNNRIDQIKEDAHGNIWTLTNYTKEVYRFDPRKEKYVTSFYMGDDTFQATDILVMPSGKVWLTSESMGAIYVPDTTNQYFIVSQENNMLKSDRVHSVWEDELMYSWILTDNGIVRIKDMGKEKKEEIFFSSDKTPDGIHSFFSSLETDDEIWFGANNGQIVCFNKSTERFDSFDTGVRSEIISIKNISDNWLIILTSKDGFFICDKYRSNLSHFNTTRLKSLPTNEMRSCFIDSNNDIWLETEAPGVARFSLLNNSLNYYPSPISSKGDLIAPPPFSIMEDKNRRIWVHPYGGGFSYYDPKTDRLNSFFNDPLSPDWKFSHMIHAQYMDDRGNIWISTRTEGIEKITFDDETFKVSDFEDKVPDLNFEIRAFFEDSDQNIWLGSKNGNIAIYDSKKRFKGYLSVNGSISKTAPPLKAMAYTMTKDRENNIWIGSKGYGVFLLKAADHNSGSYTIRNYTNNPSDNYSISHNSVYAVHEDNKGNIWIGTVGGGLNLYDKENDRFIHYKNQLTSYPIKTGHQIRDINSLDDVLYVATSLGLITISTAHMDAGTFDYKMYTKANGVKDGLMANDIYRVYITRNKDVYMATQGGGLSVVEEFDTQGFPMKFNTLDTSNKLISDVILSVIEDNKSNLWIVSEGNLSVYNQQTGEVEQFNNVARILDTKFFSEALPLLTYNGEILLGCTQGTLSFVPETIKKDSYTPNLIFTRFKVAGEDFISKGELDYVDKVNLNHHENSFTIEYAALDFSDPQSILYAYKLEGFENEWTYNQKQRQVNYANLSPGEYTFRVRTTNSNGVWTDNERSLPIIITPSFWQTGWAWALYITLFGLILFAVLRSIFVFYRMRDRMQMEQEQTEMRTRFFTDISHEIRTPLTLIVSPIEDMMEKNRVLPDARPQLQMVLKNANRMLNMVNQILDFRKIQKQKLHVTAVELGVFVEELCRNSFSFIEQRNIRLVVNNQISSEKVWVDPDGIEKMVYNLVSNAIKYSTNGKKIEVNIYKKDEMYALQVKDEGQGMSKEVQSKLFTRFASFNTDKSKPSTGIGLSIVKEVADKHHAKILVESAVNKGSVFTVLFHPGLVHFSDDGNVEIVNPEHHDLQEKKVSFVTEETEGSTPDVKEEPMSILVVEDDTDLRHFIQSVLSPHYKVYEASNGREGYEATVEHLPDFILSDIMMPEMNGIELLQAIRKNNDTSHIPVILLTAKTGIENELEGITSGANDYITKPFNVKLLKAKIENILKQRKLFTAQFTNHADRTETFVNDSTKSHITAYDEEFLKKVTDIINVNMDNSELVIEDLARGTNVSRKVFYIKVKSLTGLAPVEFLREMRIKRAAHLILTNDYLIKEVAYMVGFSDNRHFSKSFKHIYGVIPSEYRKQHTEGRDN